MNEPRAAGRIARNTGFLLAAEVAGRAVSFVAGVSIARVLGVADYGIFSFAFSFAALFVMICDFGLAVIAVRDIAADRSRVGWYTGTIAAVRLALAVPTIGLLTAALFIAQHSAAIRETTLLFGASLVLNALAEVFTAAFRAFERMGRVSAVMLVQRAGAPVLGLLLLSFGHGLRGVVLGYAAGSLAALLLSVYLFVTRAGTLSVRTDIASWKPIVTSALPLAVSMVFSTVYFRMDAVMLAALRGTDAVGVFHAAWRLMEALMFVPMSFVGALFPVLTARFAAGNHDAVRGLLRRGCTLLAVLVLPLAVWMTSYAGSATEALYGGAFARSAAPLAVLMWAEVAIFVNYLLTQALVAAHLQRFNAVYTAVCAGVGILLNLVLIPRFAETGAALATLATECVLFALCLRRINRVVGPMRLTGALALPVLAAGGMALTLWILRGSAMVVASVAGIGVYVALVCALGVIRVQDVRCVRDTISATRDA